MMNKLRPIKAVGLRPLNIDDRLKPLNASVEDIYNDKPFRVQNYRMKR